MKFIKIFLVLLLSAGAALAQDAAPKKLRIVASINPIYQIILAITEDKNNSILIIDPTISEHNFVLKKTDVAAVANADLVFFLDESLEKNFAKLLKNPEAQEKSFQLSQVNGLKLLQIRENPKNIDPHLWENPQNAIKIAEFITQKIAAIDLKNSKKYQKNFEKFRKEVLQSEKKIRAQLAKINDYGFVFYHDGYQYFEDYFDIKPLKIISHNHDYELGIKDMRAFNKLVQEGRVKCIFGEPQDEKNSALKLAQKYQIKFSILDSIGLKENPDGKVNGYSVLLQNFADDLMGCLE